MTAMPITGRASSGGNVRSKRMGLAKHQHTPVGLGSGNAPRRRHDFFAHEQELCDDTEHVEVNAKRE